MVFLFKQVIKPFYFSLDTVWNQTELVLFSGWQRRSVDDGYDDSWSGVDRGGLWQTTSTRSLHSSLSVHTLDIRYIARNIRMKIRRFLCLTNILNLFKFLAWESAAESDTFGRRWNTQIKVSATVYKYREENNRWNNPLEKYQTKANRFPEVYDSLPQFPALVSVTVQ